MVNKRVPDWLNSSLWSSTPLEDDERPSRQSTNTTTTISYSPTVEPTLDPPTPPAPPSPTRVEPEKPPETKDSPSNDSHSSDLSYNDISEEVDSSTVDISRQSQLLAEISKKVINIRDLRRISSQGIPDIPGIRSMVWKLLLGYLPPDRGLWSLELTKRRLQYKQFKEELLMNPSEITWRLDKTRSCDKDNSKSESRGLLSRSEITHGEHPLSLGKTSIWNQFFQDTEIIEQIDRDVKRTHPGMHFFSGDSQFAECNQEALKNILIIFAKLNPGIKYVQGMNEILAPLFYIFRNDPEEENAVNPQFYAFRWITLLLTQEFNFSDSLHIWDTLLSDPEGPQETLLRICCAMLILIRRRLLAGDFTSNLKLLQNYPPTNISHLLYVANTLRVRSIG
ncbi:TBC1 domain family member 13 isoform X4 [Carya illinoinensis]|uniref:TBC1 domain family member 13 isoform X4 n=1 Tax=Carya illinoinensis TaxID=32201 RepID=UPI001C728476|nr:TBC1 domain family member 13 isoform X4 [Carya illinoinensis]